MKTQGSSICTFLCAFVNVMSLAYQAVRFQTACIFTTMEIWILNIVSVFVIWISWVLYLNMFLISVWYVRTGSNLCSMMTWIFYPKLYLYIVDTCLYLLMTIVYIHIWWQFPHLYDLWNMNKWDVGWWLALICTVVFVLLIQEGMFIVFCC